MLFLSVYFFSKSEKNVSWHLIFKWSFKDVDIHCFDELLNQHSVLAFKNMPAISLIKNVITEVPHMLLHGWWHGGTAHSSRDPSLTLSFGCSLYVVFVNVLLKGFFWVLQFLNFPISCQQVDCLYAWECANVHICKASRQAGDVKKWKKKKIRYTKGMRKKQTKLMLPKHMTN